MYSEMINPSSGLAAKVLLYIFVTLNNPTNNTIIFITANDQKISRA
jgi:hypothetical protein